MSGRMTLVFPSVETMVDTYMIVTGRGMSFSQRSVMERTVTRGTSGVMVIGFAVFEWEAKPFEVKVSHVSKHQVPEDTKLSKMTLFSAMAMGQEFTVVKQGVTYSGRITRIELESGFTPPAQPN